MDVASGVALDSAGNAYVIGQSQSTNFPTTPGALQTSPPAARYFGFLFKIDPPAGASGSITSVSFGSSSAVTLAPSGQSVALGAGGSGALSRGETFSADIAAALSLVSSGHTPGPAASSAEQARNSSLWSVPESLTRLPAVTDGAVSKLVFHTPASQCSPGSTDWANPLFAPESWLAGGWLNI
jgi:hypothetical protein